MNKFVIILRYIFRGERGSMTVTPLELLIGFGVPIIISFGLAALFPGLGWYVFLIGYGVFVVLGIGIIFLLAYLKDRREREDGTRKDFILEALKKSEDRDETIRWLIEEAKRGDGTNPYLSYLIENVTKVPCVKCGTMVLLATAKKTGGQCTRCAKKNKK